MPKPAQTRSTPPTYVVGDVLASDYRIRDVIGAGGMAVVVRAEQLSLGRDVALKLVARDRSGGGQRMREEARTLGQLDSDHLCNVIATGVTEHGDSYIAMELLQGEDLAAHLQRVGPIDETRAAALLLQACAGLAVAHAAQVVHRDLKPSNLFLHRRSDGTETLKVIDFGIAKRVDAEQDTGLTQTGAVIGSPRYLSPEQLSGGPIDQRTDIWALGLVLYELLTGQAAFDEPTSALLHAAILQGEPTDLRSLRGELSPRIIDVVTRCLRKAPDGRFSSVDELAAQLAPCAGESGRTPGVRSAALQRPSAPTPRIEPKPAVTETSTNAVIPNRVPEVPSAGSSQRASIRNSPATRRAWMLGGLVTGFIILSLSAVVISRLGAPSRRKIEATPSTARSSQPAAPPPSTLSDAVVLIGHPARNPASKPCILTPNTTRTTLDWTGKNFPTGNLAKFTGNSKVLYLVSAAHGPRTQDRAQLKRLGLSRGAVVLCDAGAIDDKELISLVGGEGRDMLLNAGFAKPIRVFSDEASKSPTGLQSDIASWLR